MNFSLVNKTRGKVPRVPFVEIKNEVLGKQYDLSLAFLPESAARLVTQKTKQKDKASNVLAFPLSKTSGEILLCPKTARAEAKSYHMSADECIAYLFIHGTLHLRGHTHGCTMEREEHRIMKKFGLCAHEYHCHWN